MRANEPELTLRACPHCGGGKIEKSGVTPIYQNGEKIGEIHHRYECRDCRRTFASDEDAAKAWNARAAALTAEQVRDAIEKAVGCTSWRGMPTYDVLESYMQAIADELNASMGGGGR